MAALLYRYFFSCCQIYIVVVYFVTLHISLLLVFTVFLSHSFRYDLYSGLPDIISKTSVFSQNKISKSNLPKYAHVKRPPRTVFYYNRTVGIPLIQVVNTSTKSLLLQQSSLYSRNTLNSILKFIQNFVIGKIGYKKNRQKHDKLASLATMLILYKQNKKMCLFINKRNTNKNDDKTIFEKKKFLLFFCNYFSLMVLFSQHKKSDSMLL